MDRINVISSGGRMWIWLALAVLISGCASGLSKEECRLADWRTIGYEDGVRGLPQSRIREHRKDCAEYGVALNLDSYRRGWDEGVRRYCQPGNGFRQGRAGRGYNGVCPAALEPAFLEAHRHGREIHDLHADVNRLQHSLNHKYSRMDDIEVEIRDTGIELVTGNMPTEHRVILLDELRKLEQERTATKAQIPELEAELEYRRQRLETLSASRQY